MPQIEVGFDIDVNGIVHVAAKDLGTGRTQSIRITDTVKLSEAEIKRMEDEAKRFEAEDKERMEEVETRNHADSLLWSTEKTLKELGDKVPADVKKKVEGAAAELKTAIQVGDIPDVKAKTAHLLTVSQEIGAAIYQQGQAASANPSGGATHGFEESDTGAGGHQGDAPGPAGQANESSKETRTKKGKGKNSIDVEYEVADNARDKN
jgi:molecular chaperone DnaK